MVNISMKYFKIITKRIINTTTVYISWTRKVSHLISRTSFCLYELISFSFSLPLFVCSFFLHFVWSLDLSLGMNACNCVGAKHVYSLENYNCCQTIFFFVFSLNIAHCICGWQANDLEDNESFFCERARLYVTTGFYA